MTTFSGKELIFQQERCCEVGAAELDSATLGPGQLLVEIRYSLISQGTELANYTGLDPGTRRAGSWNCYPHRPGYASTGTMVAAGPPADGTPVFATGDQVFAITNHARYGVADPATRPVIRLRHDDDQRTLILCRMAAVAMTAIRKSGSVDLGGHAVVVGPRPGRLLRRTTAAASRHGRPGHRRRRGAARGGRRRGPARRER
jgi:NADPH:quinone reductase-like Zn-dependent oxidoreductase